MAPTNVSYDTSYEIHQQTLPSVADFFRGKNVFLTGASGFIGRTLIEKLLREAPDIGTIFVLLRPKKGKRPEERVAAMMDVKLFQRLRKQRPSVLSKVQAVAGDAQDPALGLSAADAAMLQEHVHVAFHVAASVRFDDPLKKAVLLNVRGTQEMCQLAMGMKKLQAFIHVSTAFCNSDKLTNEEYLHPPPGDWKTFVEAAETMDEHCLRCLTNKLLGGHPNTYVFTKALAEQVVKDYKDFVPSAIIRPSVVIGSLQEPFAGWVDNLNGPFALCLGASIGIKHSTLVTDGIDIDNIPVDLCVNGTVLLAMERAQTRDKKDLKIVNATKYNANIFDVYDVREFLRLVQYDRPMTLVYKPFMIFVKSRLIDLLLTYTIDIPIALFYEILAWLTGAKISMMKIQRKIYLGTRMLQPFTTQIFQFPNEKYLGLESLVNPVDQGKFNLSPKSVVEVTQVISCISQLKQLFMKENKTPISQHILIEVIHYGIVGFILFLVGKSELPSVLFNLLLKLLFFCLCIN